MLMQKLAKRPRAYMSARVSCLPEVIRMMMEKKTALAMWMR